MTDFNSNTTQQHLLVPVVEPIHVATAERLCRLHARSDEEFAEFVDMVAPKDFRCAGCGRMFPVKSLARDHELTHQEEENPNVG